MDLNELGDLITQRIQENDLLGKFSEASIARDEEGMDFFANLLFIIQGIINPKDE